MNKSNQVQVIGMSWYKEHEYLRIRDIFDDGYKLPSTYSKWLQQAQNNFNNLTAQGNTVIKIYINPDTFPNWCIQRGLSIDSSSRIEFANFKALEYINSNKVFHSCSPKN